jgi:protein-S-isoprenylcysteine O-methyltransferase Ste14
MELFPDLEFGLLNGWILLGFHVLLQGSLMLIFPKDVNERLLDRSTWTKKQRLFLILGKIFSLATLVLIILTPLKIDSPLLIIGIVVYLIGLAGLVVSMINFRDTAPNSLVSKGLYRVSRHPQIVSLFILFTGMSIAIGSWVAFFTLLMSRILQHYAILAEEEACLTQYGDAYRSYMEQVPRYLFIF